MQIEFGKYEDDSEMGKIDLHPRRPSIGFTSDNFSTFDGTSASCRQSGNDIFQVSQGKEFVKGCRIVIGR